MKHSNKIVKKLKSFGTLKHGINTLLNITEATLNRPVIYSKPMIVDVVLTKACNLKCIFCKDYETAGAKKLSLARFEKIAETFFPTATRLRLCSGGEPYLVPELEDMLRIAKQYRVPAWVLSNGMLLNEKRIKTIVREGLIEEHGFSVDGIKKSTVEAIRINSKLNVIIENIKKLIFIRKIEKRIYPKVIIRYALMRSNIEELPAAVEYWGKLGVNRLETCYLSMANNIDHHESLYYHPELTRKIFKASRKVALHYPRLRLNLPELIKKDPQSPRQPKNCRYPWYFIQVDSDGRLIPCYNSWGALTMGNIADSEGQAFKAIWNGEAYQKLRSTVNDNSGHNFFPFCGVCPERHGMGSLESHMGDETWEKFLDMKQDEKNRFMSFRSRQSE